MNSSTQVRLDREHSTRLLTDAHHAWLHHNERTPQSVTLLAHDLYDRLGKCFTGMRRKMDEDISQEAQL